MSSYALGREGAEKIESERLALLAEVYDPLTEYQLDAIGVAEGWSCLDAGAGAGAVTRLLAARVGGSGSVLATDLDVRLLEGLASETVEVRQHDLLADTLPRGAFDLVHARCLLMHLPSRLEALRRLRAAVRPDGWIAICDSDFSTIEISTSSVAWRRVWSAFLDATIATGWDSRYGARLEGDLDAIELRDLRTESVCRRVPGGSPWPRLFAATLERMRDRLRAAGAQDDEVEEAQRLLRDPATRVVTATAWLGTGRTPGA